VQRHAQRVRWHELLRGPPSEEIVMSIASAIAAEHGEEKRKEWLSKLEVARAAMDWTLVDALIEEMARFYFDE
jgi:hypothetical protein